jgi:hypothetical protein
MGTCGDPIDSADEDVSQQDHNRTRNIVFSVRSATEETIGHLEIAIIGNKEETATEQARRQGNA